MQTLYFDISKKNTTPVLELKQGDVGRQFRAVITDDGAAYTIPGDARFTLWYSGPSGEGNYSAVGERSAFAIQGNAVAVELIAQMTQNPGNGTLCLVLNAADGTQIGLWNAIYVVEQVPGLDSKAAEIHYTALSEVARQAILAAETFETDATMTATGKAADAAAVGAALAGKAPAVESVNHPGCYYRTVNGVTEWINPPMVPGVEYRTTQRWNGKAVYTMLVDFGAMPNVNTKTVNTQILNATGVTGISAVYQSGNVSGDILVHKNVTGHWVDVLSDGLLIGVITDKDLTAYRVYFTLKYIKD